MLVLYLELWWPITSPDTDPISKEDPVLSPKFPTLPPVDADLLPSLGSTATPEGAVILTLHLLVVT
jgi:hypothetical protein